MNKITTIWRKILPDNSQDKPYYSTCKELPLTRFIWCLVQGDVWHLMKPGRAKVSKAFLEEVWENIFYEYLAICKDDKHTQVITLMKEITRMNTRFILIYEIVRQLKMRYNSGLVEQLKRLGFKRFTYDHSDYDQYRKELDLTLSQAKVSLIRTEQKQKELEALQPKGKGKKHDPDYEALLVELSKFQGYRIDPDVVTVAEFVAISNRYRAHMEALERQHKKKNGQYGKN